MRDKKGLSIVLKEIEYVDGSNQSYKVFHVLIGTDKCLTFLKGQFGSTISGNAVQMAKDEAPEQKHSAWVEAWEKLNVRNWLDSYKAEDAQAVKDEDKWYVTYREEGGKARQIKGFGVHPADFEQNRKDKVQRLPDTFLDKYLLCCRVCADADWNVYYYGGQQG